MAEPDEREKSRVLSLTYQEWNRGTPRHRNSQVRIRLLYWWSDGQGYWQEFCSNCDKVDPLRVVFHNWAGIYKPGVDVDDFDYSIYEQEGYLDDVDKTPLQVGIIHHATIVVEDPEYDSD